jgi:hypothetical protein
MAWLWSFPMKPDPGGKDPHGVSTAPRSWTMVHRALGYIFVLIYVALLFEMVPRLWEFRVFSAVTVIHAILGAIVGLLLAVKIAIFRRFQRFGGNLPWIGGTLAATAVVMNGIAIVPAWIALRPFTPMTPQLAAGRDVVAAKCFQCHGASTIVSEREDARKWDRVTRKMQRFSERIPGKNFITDQERVLAAAYLASFLGDSERRDKPRGRDRDPVPTVDQENADEAAPAEEERGDEGGRRRRRGGRDRDRERR